jgi:N6-L-threonylcarbamoyladenine synthase
VLVLGIESSCDETSASVVEDGRTVHSLVIASQTEIHARYHGVVPEVASRAHTEQIQAVVASALSDAGLSPDGRELNGVAVTNRPGLSGSLAVGVAFAKTFALTADLPLVAVNHMHAHAYAAYLSGVTGAQFAAHAPTYPAIVLLVSGGHTLIAISRSPTTMDVLGTTIDDACGEAYDKISAFLGLGYPGGPAVDRYAQEGDARAFDFPQARLNHARSPYDMSYSGLKTAVVHQLDRFWNGAYPKTVANVAAAFQRSAITMLTDRVERALVETGIARVIVGGGVAANGELRRQLAIVATRYNATVIIPPVELCMDNGAMVAGLGGVMLAQGVRSQLTVGVSARIGAFRSGGVRRAPEKSLASSRKSSSSGKSFNPSGSGS